VLSQLGHGAHEASRQEFLRDVKALELVHGLNLLLALGACVIQSLVLLLDEVDLTFDFLLPLLVIVFLALLVLLFEFADLLELSLFLHFKNGLLN